ncbi:hypothetical protein GY45DRAFT_1039209 [Cubamyces sp. BRFM 1775]|nr:hypothetical protein GY45DRAFT_1039209 [Cubamyces sp. BRFM 1775]
MRLPAATTSCGVLWALGDRRTHGIPHSSACTNVTGEPGELEQPDEKPPHSVSALEHSTIPASLLLALMRSSPAHSLNELAQYFAPQIQLDPKHLPQGACPWVFF